MLKLLKLFINVKECLNSLIKNEWLNFIKISSEEDDNLSEIIDITFQTVNQWEIFHQKTFFLLIKEIVVINKVIYVFFLIFLILTRFNTHYESMQDSIYCSERCASAALFSHQKSLLFALCIITVFNARTLWVYFFFIFSLFHLTF